MSRRFASFAAVAVFALVLVSPGVADAQSPADPDRIPGSWIVTVEPGNSPDQVAADHARDNGAQVSHVYRYALRGYSARMSDTAAARVAADPRVRTVVADHAVHTDEQSLPTGIDRIDADTNATAQIDGIDQRVDVDVAIIDTGIDPTHPDLNVVDGKNCSRGNSWADGNGHGTHVSGTVAALDNGIGVVGVAPGARLHAVRVLDNSGSGSWSSVICGIDWVTSRASTIKVANMSLGGTASEGTCTDGGLHQAICASVNAGVTYVVAAGNSAVDAKTSVPASFDQVITVSALADFNGQPGGGAAATCRTDVDDTFADFSNYGADVDIIAPGVCIQSTWKGGGYNTISGTSMATPHVTGAAALYKATNPSATPTQVQAALQAAGTDNWATGTDPDGTHEPLLNVAGSFSPPPGTNSPPTASFTPACTDLTCSFNATTSSDTDGTIASYTWSFGDGTTGTGATVNHTYAAADTYTVTLTVTDNEGATGTASQSVTAAAPPDSTASYTTSTSYTPYGGKTGDRHMDISVHVTNGTNPATGASVAAEVFKNGQSLGTSSALTDSAGNVAFAIKNGGPGCYTTNVTSVNGTVPTSTTDAGSPTCSP